VKENHTTHLTACPLLGRGEFEENSTPGQQQGRDDPEGLFEGETRNYLMKKRGEDSQPALPRERGKHLQTYKQLVDKLRKGGIPPL